MRDVKEEADFADHLHSNLQFICPQRQGSGVQQLAFSCCSQFTSAMLLQLFLART